MRRIRDALLLLMSIEQKQFNEHANLASNKLTPLCVPYPLSASFICEPNPLPYARALYVFRS